MAHFFKKSLPTIFMAGDELRRRLGHLGPLLSLTLDLHFSRNLELASVAFGA